MQADEDGVVGVIERVCSASFLLMLFTFVSKTSFVHVLFISAFVLFQVHIDNFMCHSQFTWEPNQRVNFVTGANGSGKSSMLQVLASNLPIPSISFTLRQSHWAYSGTQRV